MMIINTLLTQYANSPVIMGLLEGLNDALDPNVEIESFYNIVLNLSTAKGYGLDIWGRIVGIGRNVPTDLGNEPKFGFYRSEYKPFNVAPFNSNGGNFASYSLPDDLYRQLIIIKAYSNILYATAPNINKFLYYIFEDRAYYRIMGGMHGQYVFEFNPTQFERLIIFHLNILPIPCGVSVEYSIEDTTTTFGFLDSDRQPFNQGVFRNG